MTLFLDRQLLIKALRFGLNTLSLRDPASPLRFHGAGKQMIVMPVRAVAPAADPKPTPAGEPATANKNPPPAAEQPSKTMQSNTNGQQHSNGANGPTVTSASAATTDKPEARTALEAALVQVEGVKTSFREAINGLTKLGDSIRHAMREQKASEKEVHNVRQTLRSLQSVRL